ncbi:methyltransferase FkbM [Rhizobium freirei PRF 81]|uniref:Methyltransferase FkbM n=1 Tax=Rhizobium freirei PRF 81 TaxID=363754 RepID=N6U1I8_9HYPH|nr:FkbM family methyltransferase [Rhizobium freirei]ENN84228.1 methyltransferase FkbM [Rhizobium freirei PRF 81]
MKRSDFRNRLSSLFQTYNETAFKLRRAAITERLQSAAEIYIFGAGQNGQHVADLLGQISLKAVAYIDDTPAKQNTIVTGLPVYSLDYLAGRGKTILITSIFSPHIGFSEISARLRSQDIEHVSLFEFLWVANEDDSSSFYFLNHPTFLHRHAEDIRWLLDRLVDEESLAQLLAHIHFRLNLDYGALPAVQRVFWPSAIPSEKIVYLDCGAYDGDTLIPFMQEHSNRVRLALPIEPDPHNFHRMTNNLASLSADDRRKIIPIAAATGETSGKLKFDLGKNQASSLSEAGSSEVDVAALDEIIEKYCEPNDHILVKIDVEGADLATLKGAKRSIIERKVWLAISVYHAPSDLWALPQYVSQLDQNYRFALRSNGCDGADLMVYAFVPNAADLAS